MTHTTRTTSPQAAQTGAPLTKEQHRAYTYHAECEMWYVVAFHKCSDEMNKRIMQSNAEWHHKQADAIRAGAQS